MDKLFPDRKWKSYLLVALQFVTLGAIFASGPLLAEGLFLVLELAGIGLGVWAVLVMGLGNFNIIPDPLDWGKMVNLGPYRFIRHPMYLALLLTTFPLVLDSFSLLRAAVWTLLLGTLVIKISYEESMLVDKFPSYREYIQATSRLIPGLY